MADPRFTFRIRWRWWVRPYVYGLAFTAWLMQMRPDEQKLARILARGMRVEWEIHHGQR